MGLNGFVEERIEIWRWVMKNDDDGGRSLNFSLSGKKSNQKGSNSTIHGLKWHCPVRFGRIRMLQRHKVCILGKSIHHRHHCLIALCLWQSGDEIH
ncbi:hypothetical protein MTR_5g095835 [Medicago truncatula]|uniref:Uncharacterized protein n=1 Tax=Medicago truncatula TaxID=3880 RepID=A0A072UFD6_MEDTR|nr:hypothetical protein MTR_5g095835 [Medicago truncatula]